MDREGLDGVVGLAGDDGRAGAENERDPRLPPPDARAHASALTRTRPRSAMRLVMARNFLVFTGPSPRPVGASSPLYPRCPLPPERLSRDEQHLAGRLASLERPVGLGGLLERELELGPQLELAVTDPAQELSGPLEQLLAARDVVVEARARDEQRALGVERLQVEGADGPARLSVERHHAARSEAVEPLV